MATHTEWAVVDAVLTANQADFTADVIIALDNPTAAGLYIPNLSIPAQWDRGCGSGGR